jgi:hypothetical protein
VVRASLEAAPREWLFEAPRGGPFTEEAHFIAWANRVYEAVFGKPVTANILRHAFISAIDVNRTTTAALEATAARFGHSLATQIAYRRLSPSKKLKASAVDDGELLVALRSATDDEAGTGAAEGEAQPQELEAARALLALS